MNEASCMKLNDREYITGYIADDINARFYQLGITRESRVIPGISESSVLSTPNLGLFSE